MRLIINLKLREGEYGEKDHWFTFKIKKESINKVFKILILNYGVILASLNGYAEELKNMEIGNFSFKKTHPIFIHCFSFLKKNKTAYKIITKLRRIAYHDEIISIEYYTTQNKLKHFQ